MHTKKFQRTVESFDCENCGMHTDGDGYTDHCPNCLWSKHVDINPGDRSSKCHGLMEPIGLSTKNGKPMIEYTCRECGCNHRVKVAENDNQAQLLSLSAQQSMT